jgi:DNA-binding MarR family transcriptional regulator
MHANAIHESVDAKRLSHLLWEVGAHSAALSETAFADTPLTPATAGVLDVIAANPGTSIAELARRLPTSAQGVSQLVSRLEAMGYLERRLGDRGHGVALFVTNSGEDARLEADRHKSELEDQLASTLGQRNYDHLVRLLIRARPVIAEMAAARR